MPQVHHSYMSFKDKKGYIATISAIIITGIVLAISLAISTGSFLSRFDSNGLETKDVSKEAALSCLEIARLKLKLGVYSGGETVTVGNYACDILAIQTSGNTKIIKSSAIVDSRRTNLEMIVDGATLQTISLKEKAVW